MTSILAVRAKHSQPWNKPIGAEELAANQEYAPGAPNRDRNCFSALQVAQDPRAKGVCNGNSQLRFCRRKGQKESAKNQSAGSCRSV
jgi:hypothetical protein